MQVPTCMSVQKRPRARYRLALSASAGLSPPKEEPPWYPMRLTGHPCRRPLPRHRRRRPPRLRRRRPLSRRRLRRRARGLGARVVVRLCRVWWCTRLVGIWRGVRLVCARCCGLLSGVLRARRCPGSGSRIWRWSCPWSVRSWPVLVPCRRPRPWPPRPPRPLRPLLGVVGGERGRRGPSASAGTCRPAGRVRPYAAYARRVRDGAGEVVARRGGARAAFRGALPEGGRYQGGPGAYLLRRR